MGELVQRTDQGEERNAKYDGSQAALISRLEMESGAQTDFAQRLTSTSLSGLLAKLGFDEREAAVLTKLLTEWSDTIEKDAFESRFQNIKAVQALAVLSEFTSEPPTLTEQAHGLGEAIFWATMCKRFDPSFPDRMETFKAASVEEYHDVERQIEGFLRGHLFDSTNPNLKILKQEYAQSNKPIQTAFVKGLIDPFVRVYDEHTHESFIDKIKSFFTNLGYHPPSGVADLNLSRREELLLQGIANEPSAEQHGNLNDDSRRIRLILETQSGNIDRMLQALHTELSENRAIDQETLILVLKKLNCRTSALEKKSTVAEQVCAELKKRKIGQWSIAEGESYQDNLAIKALMSVNRIDSDRISEIAKLMEAAMVAAESSYKPGEKFSSQCRNLVAALLIEKSR